MLFLVHDEFADWMLDDGYKGTALVCRCAKQRSEPTSDKRGAKADELTFTPLELIDRIAALVPPPRMHRHRYFGVLAPNSPLRATALAAPAKQVAVQAEPPHISPARRPPLWDDCDAQMDDGGHIEPDWDLAPQAPPDYKGDQRIN